MGFNSGFKGLNKEFTQNPYLCKHNNQVTAHSRFLHEQLTSSQLAKKFPAFYGTRRFITAFTRARHLSLF